MLSPRGIVWSLATVLALCSCSHGGNVRPSCPPPVVHSAPTLPPTDPELMEQPRFEQRALQRGFRTAPPPMPGSTTSKPN